MKTKIKAKIKDEHQASLWDAVFVSNLVRTVEWFGSVNHENLKGVLGKVKTLLSEDREQGITLLVNSPGGATGIAMSFYDTMRSVLKPALTTIGTGDVDSSGVILFLAGEKRLLTRNTTLLFHLAGRTFGTEKRFSTADLEDILKEDKLKDYQYACAVSDATEGRLTPEKVLIMMKKNTVLTAEEAVNLGLAHRII
ncbi:ATP-dependent Clp protease proteolytic subunit [Candidatus Parcubacteria bacterium]|nr:ATP-dependent Clp protease proteolytic subunit [Candidatus Parcubacteria bacterium]